MGSADPPSSNIARVLCLVKRFVFSPFLLLLLPRKDDEITILFWPLADGSDFASVEKNISLFKGFGSANKESVAELFVTLMSKVSTLQQHIYFNYYFGSYVA